MRALAGTGAAIAAERAELVVTAGTMPVLLPRLRASGAGLDAVDVHVHHANGGLPLRADLEGYAGAPRLSDPGFPLLGCACGIPKDPGPTAEDVTEAYERRWPRGRDVLRLGRVASRA